MPNAPVLASPNQVALGLLLCSSANRTPIGTMVAYGPAAPSRSWNAYPRNSSSSPTTPQPSSTVTKIIEPAVGSSSGVGTEPAARNSSEGSSTAAAAPAPPASPTIRLADDARFHQRPASTRWRPSKLPSEG